MQIHTEKNRFLKCGKYWMRSKSWRFAVDSAYCQESSNRIESFRWEGHAVYYRPGTSDSEVIHRILLKPNRKREYHFPKHLNPKIIYDIGGNIGITSLLLSKVYPKAKIYVFEPEQENFNVLKKNIQAHPSIQAFPVALGNQTETRRFFLTEDLSNRGGFSTYYQGEGPRLETSLQVKEVNQFLKTNQIPPADLIKIDTEGAEHEILTSLEAEHLQQAQWIMGELHGQRDFELMDYLSQWFAIGLHKDVFNRLATFEAERRKNVAFATNGA